MIEKETYIEGDKAEVWVGEVLERRIGKPQEVMGPKPFEGSSRKWISGLFFATKKA